MLFKAAPRRRPGQAVGKNLDGVRQPAFISGFPQRDGLPLVIALSQISCVKWGFEALPCCPPGLWRKVL